MKIILTYISILWLLAMIFNYAGNSEAAYTSNLNLFNCGSPNSWSKACLGVPDDVTIATGSMYNASPLVINQIIRLPSKAYDYQVVRYMNQIGIGGGVFSNNSNFDVTHALSAAQLARYSSFQDLTNAQWQTFLNDIGGAVSSTNLVPFLIYPPTANSSISSYPRVTYKDLSYTRITSLCGSLINCGIYAGSFGFVRIIKLTKNVIPPLPGPFTASVTNTCNNTNCLRNATITWTQATNASYYRYEAYKNGALLSAGTRPTTNRSYSIPQDDGNNTYSFAVQAVNTSNQGTMATWPSGNTTGRCAPYAAFTNPPNCTSGSTENIIGWRKCFADTSTLTRAECKYIQPTYEFRMSIDYTNSRPTENDVRSKLSSVAGLNLDNVEIRGEFDIRVKNMMNSTLEQPIKEVLRQLGHYKDTEKSNRIGVPLPTICPIGNCGAPTNLLSGSNLLTYTDTTFNPAVPNRYSITVTRASDGATFTSTASDLKSCNALQTGLTIQYDPNIAINPPPGFSDLFAPVFKELVPK